jgi:hypothetical protein
VATSSVTYTFTALTKAQAAQVNQNFTNLTTFLNTDVVHVDGSKSMTGALTLPNSDPSNNNHAARKKYVDDAIKLSGWSSWTPSLTAATTNPTLGTGSSAQGIYVQIGKLVIAQFSISFGTSGVNAGSGIYSVSLPVTAKATFGSNPEHRLGVAVAFDNSTFFAARPMISLNTTTTVGFVYPLSAEPGLFGNVAHDAPWTWAASDNLSGFMMYEAA